MTSGICLLVAGVVLAAACNAQGEPASTAKRKAGGGKAMAIKVVSTAFEEGKMIPKMYTCDGPNVSPPLSWTGVPKGAKSLALICDDPDAPSKTWVHWVIFNIPPDTLGLPEHVPPDSTLPSGAQNGISDFGKFGYGGPCPPSGTHRYFFRLYTLDTVLNLSGRVTKKDLLAAMEKHILAEGQLMGRYKRE